jgi:hypothetical protein
VRQTPARRAAAPLVPPAAVVLGGLTLHVSTMAPTVLWGDDAELQRIAVTGEVRVIGQSGSASHLLWLALARPFVASTGWLPLDVAGRARLVSALCAALALGAVSCAGAELARRTTPHLAAAGLAGVAAAVALWLSHTLCCSMSLYVIDFS